MMKNNHLKCHPVRTLLHPAFLLVFAAGATCSASDAVAGKKHHTDYTRWGNEHHLQGQWGQGRQGRACPQTSQVAYKACGYDVRDNYLLAQAKCLNVTDPNEKATCLGEAKSTREEERTYCGEVRAARLEVCDALSMGTGPYDPPIDSIDWIAADHIVGNSYFPLVKGTKWVYHNTDGETITVTVTDETTEIQGVPVVVVSDVVELDGKVTEDTIDWYAQDADGNVWYFGETTMATNDENMLVSVDGSWQAGVEGAEPGIIMPAVPAEGDVYRQEWLLGDAEDVAEVLSTTESESAPTDPGPAVVSCTGTCVKTHDYTPLEPDLSESKFFAPGVGVIVVLDDNDPEFREELVQIISP